VQNLLSELPNKEGISPDSLGYKILKICRLTLTPMITEIFRLSLDSMKLPAIWKDSIIMPIFKSGKRDNVGNYRPISLTCVLCRTLERIIAQQLTDYLITHDIISKHQYGFMKQRSTNTQLITCLEDWYKALYEEKNIDVIYIDYKKAFDSVPINLLLYKLDKIGIKGKLYGWISNFLTNRTFRVKIADKFSSSRTVYSGVPQGSVLGPLLFIIYINDLPRFLSKNTNIVIYADDVKIYKAYKTEIERNELQSDLSKIEQWSKIWALDISSTKTFVFHLGNKNCHHDYFINGIKLSQVEVIRDLGVNIDNKLKFDKHIAITTKKAYFKAHQIFRNIKSKSPKTWNILYKSYVRPQLEYATESWNPILKQDINKLERVQRFFTRIIYKKCNLTYKNYETRLHFLKLDSLECRRKVFDLTMLFKIFKGFTHLDQYSLFKPLNRSSRRHNCQIFIQHKNNKTRNSFINRTNNTWNNLPQEVVNSSSITQFKQKLRISLNRGL